MEKRVTIEKPVDFGLTIIYCSHYLTIIIIIFNLI